MKANGINKIQQKFYTKCANKSQKSNSIRCVMQRKEGTKKSFNHYPQVI